MPSPSANPYQHARFLKSVPSLSLAPDDSGVEVAFAGRSNAGKSTALNAITAQKSLARTSKTPGRTQHLVFFSLDDDRRLVDLPGYGYAKVPEGVKQDWQKLMQAYLSERRSLVGLILMMDIRHPLTDIDRMMLEWCQYHQLPTHVLLTKADKLKRGAAQNSLLKVRRELDAQYPVARVQVFSGLKKQGLIDARAVLDEWLYKSSS